ncbi:MAG TPA: tetratricopeptide repeat protein [Spirochaetota bacterium]|nr:tetratricopeptide repeat protein [Spirochaetota bacterium]
MIVLIIILISLAALVAAYMFYKSLSKPRLLKNAEKDMKIRYYSRAIKNLNKILKHEPGNVQALNLLGEALQKSNNAEQAIKAYRRALKDPALIGVDFEKEVRMKLANLLYDKGEHTYAFEEYLILTKLDEKNAEIYYKMGLVYKERNKLEEAVKNFQLAVKRDNKIPAYFFQLGDAYFRSGVFARAQETLEKCLRLDQQNSHAWYLLGISYKNMNNNRKAIEALQKAVKEKEYKDRSLLFIGVCYYNLEEYEYAIKELENALKQVSNENKIKKAIYYYLGLAYEKASEIIKAVEQWQKVVKIDPAYENVKDKLEKYREVNAYQEIKKFIDTSQNEFLEKGKAVITYFNYDIHEVVQTEQNLLYIVAREKTSMVGAKSILKLFIISKSTERLTEKHLRTFLDDLKKYKCGSALIVSVSSPTSDGANFMDTRPLDLVEPQELDKILTDIKNGITVRPEGT